MSDRPLETSDVRWLRRAFVGAVLALAGLLADAAAVAQQNVDPIRSLGGTPTAPAAPVAADSHPTREPSRIPVAVQVARAADEGVVQTLGAYTSGCAAIVDTGTREACWRAYRAELAYRELSLAQRARAFAWQHDSTVGIFFVVLLLVAAGLYFAWRQFEVDSRRKRGDVPQASSVELSAAGLKLTSPVLGTIILALSLGFFYLYLVYVYPIHEVN